MGKTAHSLHLLLQVDHLQLPPAAARPHEGRGMEARLMRRATAGSVLAAKSRWLALRHFHYGEGAPRGFSR